MGIDPGLSRTGFGVVEVAGGSLRELTSGTVRPDRSASVAEQLFLLAGALDAVVTAHRPDAVAVERLFFNSNARTAIRVGQASGVALLAAGRAGVPAFEYTPTEVKSAVVGVGNATKEQVGAMVARILGLASAPESADAADALALAICHAHSYRARALEARAAR